MSMLAERRRKEKWTLNPRGKWWSEDSNKFGQKMLEKMGWSKGKGLGINEQGITEYLNVAHKKDTAGIGYDENSEEWMEHQEKFNNFLQQLQVVNENQNTNQKLEKEDDLSGQSMELKSKQSRARVHYRKFTRGKDVSKYKSKDLANIFGQKELTNKVQINTEKNDSICEKETINTKENTNEIITVNGGSMTDYFKRKSNYDENFSNNVIDDQAADSESEKEQYVGFGFTPKTENVLSYGESIDFDKKSNYAFDNPCLRLNSPTEIISSTTDNTCKKSAKKRKKEYESDLHATEMDTYNVQKKLKTEFITGENGKDGFINPALNLDIKIEEDCNGKEFEVSRAQFGLENCGLDLTDETSNKKCVTFNDHVTLYEYNIDSDKKKKGKATLDKFEVENKKYKKKRKQKNITTPVSNGFVNEALDIETVCEEINDNEMNEHKSKRTKKRKIRKISNLETIQESPEREKQISEIKVESEDVLDSIVKNEETIIIGKKLKKKKKTKIENITVVVKKELDFETEEVSGDKEIRKQESPEREKQKSEIKVKSEDVLDSIVKNEETIIIDKKLKKKKKTKIENITVVVKKELDFETEEVSGDKEIRKQESPEREKQKSEIKVKSEDVLDSIVKNEETIIIDKKLKKKKTKIENINVLVKELDFETEEVSRDKEIKKHEKSKEEIVISKKYKKEKKDEENYTEECAIKTEANSNQENIEILDKAISKQQENDLIMEKKNATEIESVVMSTKEEEEEETENIEFSQIFSSWNTKIRMSKKMLVTLFRRNELLDFPGSNIHNIKGYAVDT